MKPVSGESKEGRVERLTAEQARRLLDEWKESGESLNSFSRRHGFNNERLRWWKKRFDHGVSGCRRRRRRKAPRELTFAALVPSGNDAGRWSIGSAVSVVVGTAEVRIEINDTAAVSADWLKEVVRALREESRR